MSASVCVNTEHSATRCGVVAAGSSHSQCLADALEHSTHPDTHPTSQNPRDGAGHPQGCFTPAGSQWQPGDVPAAEITAQSPKPRHEGSQAARLQVLDCSVWETPWSVHVEASQWFIPGPLHQTNRRTNPSFPPDWRWCMGEEVTADHRRLLSAQLEKMPPGVPQRTKTRRNPNISMNTT